MAIKKYLSYDRLAEYDALIKAKIDEGDESTLSSSKAYTDEKASSAKAYTDEALASAKSYTDSTAATVKNDLLNGAGEAYDTLKELGDLIDENVDAIDALEIVATGKADKEHSHDDKYYTETEIDNMVFITVDDIDAICVNTTIQMAREVKF